MQNTEPATIRLPLTRLDANPTYRTFSRPLNEEEARVLRASIEAAGCILQPIIVEFVQAKSKYDVIDGYNRWATAEALGFLDVPCLQVFTEQQRIEALLANATRRQLTPDERAALLAKGRTALTDTAQKLIPPLRPLYENGDLARILGTANAFYLTNASKEKQQALYVKIQRAFGTPLALSPDNHALQERITSLSAQVASMQRTSAQLEDDLAAAIEDKHTAEEKLETMTKSIDVLADKKAGQAQKALEQQVYSLNDRISTLTQQHEDACRKAHVLEEQLKTAESEKKAAQIYARSAEDRAHTAQQRLASPQIIISNFESIHKLLEAIKAQIVAAKPLAPEDDRLIHDQIGRTETLLADLASTLQSTTGELISFHRHLKPKNQRAEPPTVQAN